jgi:serine/threonine-protein kinase
MSPNRCGIGVLSSEKDGQVKLVLNEAHEYRLPTVSPDGHWLAYLSDESGRYEVYVRPFPNVEAGKWQVSTDGAGQPHWSFDGRELFYINAYKEMMAVTVKTERGFSSMEPVRLFDVSKYFFPLGGYPNFDLTPDGRKFLLVKPSGLQTTRILVVQNFFDELERLLPTK